MGDEAPIADAVVADAVVETDDPADALGETRAQHIASMQESLPAGLVDAFVEASHAAPRRFWIVDNSGSMHASDGQKCVAGAGGASRFVACSRWDELRASVLFHAELAARLGAPAEFMLLNPALPGAGGARGARESEFAVGRGDPAGELARARGAMSSSPTGGTPLCGAIREVARRVRACERELRAAGALAVVVIATDGEASDGDVRAAMKALASLPVWTVVRLCTSDESVVKYWNRVDADLEQQLEVLDDLASEAAEIAAHGNGWLTYGEPLQRLREWGAPQTRIFDLLDERRLGAGEVAELARRVLGGAELPHPEADWELFRLEVDARLAAAPRVLDPRSKRLKPWVDTSLLRRACGPPMAPLAAIRSLASLDGDGAAGAASASVSKSAPLSPQAMVAVLLFGMFLVFCSYSG